MKSKTFIIPAAVVALFVAIGGLVFFSTREKTPESSSVQTTQIPTQKNLPVDYLKALQGTGSVKCTYTANNSTVTTYIKDGNVRVEMTGSEGEKTNSLVVNKIAYIWQEGQGTGMMYDTSVITPEATETTEAPRSYKDADAIKHDLDSYHPTCTSESAPDSLFDKPTDITFTNMSKMMDQMKSRIPTGVTPPTGYQTPNQ